jgi:hypothetical protein
LHSSEEDSPDALAEPLPAAPEEVAPAAPDFSAVAAKWPTDARVSGTKAERRFRRLTPEQRRAAVAERYLSAMRLASCSLPFPW